ncbi:hypothetical protein L9F63_011017, partial [Diploptera punctata]
MQLICFSYIVLFISVMILFLISYVFNKNVNFFFINLVCEYKVYHWMFIFVLILLLPYDSNRWPCKVIGLLFNQ